MLSLLISLSVGSVDAPEGEEMRRWWCGDESGDHLTHRFFFIQGERKVLLLRASFLVPRVSCFTLATLLTFAWAGGNDEGLLIYCAVLMMV